MSTDQPTNPGDEFVKKIEEQVEDLCPVHDHITRVIANLDIEGEYFGGYGDPGRAKYDLDSVVQMFLYQHAREFNQSELARRLRGAAYVCFRFGLENPLYQQIISHTWRERFSLDERQSIQKAAARIREICADHDIIESNEPALDPDDVNPQQGIGEEKIHEALECATELGFSEFSADRASNCKYDLEAYFERQGYLNMTDVGTTTPRRRFRRHSPRNEVPHGSSHDRTMKKVADPDPQTRLDQFEEGRRPPNWQRIRDEVLPAFHVGVEKQLNEIAERDRKGIREPVNAAIDITSWEFWSSPFADEGDVEYDRTPVEINGRERYLKEEYPEMVSGLKDSHSRGYKFATLTIVAEDTPIVLAIEPVRDQRRWEDEDTDTRTRGELVEALLEQTQQHVDINKVFLDREFDSYEVRDAIDSHDVFYVIGKRNQANADNVAIQKTIEHETADTSVEHATLTYEGRDHDVSIIYVPKDTAQEDKELFQGDYAIFTVNAHVNPDRAQGLTQQYRKRWRIENQYARIKGDFLPITASKDYRIRFLYFTIGVMMYNVWRLTNFILRDDVSVHLGESPPIPAGEIVELIVLTLFDPGG